jgi:integrase/recombinase XerD
MYASLQQGRSGSGHTRLNHTGDIQLGRGETANTAFKKTLEAFLATLKARKYSQETVKKRRDCLRKFLLYLEARGIQRFADVDAKTLEEFRLCLIEHDYSPSEQEATLRSILFLFRYLAEQNLVFDNPAARLKIPKAPLNLGRVLNEKEIQRLLAVPDLTKPRGLRDRALLEVLYSTGMRRGEAVGLAIHDVDLDRGTVKVLGKGRKQRLIPLGKHAVKYLRLYLQEARPRLLPKFMPATAALWFDRRREGMTAQSIGHVVKTCARGAGLTGIDTHTLRRTCATQLLRGGAHPAVVAQILGHSGLRSLSHYLRTTITDLQKSHSQTNPGH